MMGSDILMDALLIEPQHQHLFQMSPEFRASVTAMGRIIPVLMRLLADDAIGVQQARRMQATPPMTLKGDPENRATWRHPDGREVTDAEIDQAVAGGRLNGILVIPDEFWTGEPPNDG